MSRGTGKAFVGVGLGLCLAAGVSLAGMEVRLGGLVEDVGGTPQPGVRVKAFSGGLLRGAAVTDAQGRYEVSFSWEADDDPSVVIWWLPVSDRQVPELLILRESGKAKAAGLWSPCLPRLELAPELSYDLTLRREDEKLDQIAGTDCLKESEKDIDR